MTIGDIVHLEFHTTNFDNFKKYYSVFNWKFEPWGDDYMTFGTPNRSGGGLILTDTPMPNQNMYPYILVDDVNSFLPKMKEIGWIVAKEKSLIPEVGYYATLNDFDGNTILLFESLPEQK